MSVGARTTRAPGRPRDPSLDDAIVAATIEMLASEGFARLSIEGVAQRAGVGKPTIYRRWPTKTALVMEALDRSTPTVEMPAEGTVRERLTGLLMELMRSMRSGPRSHVMASLVAEIHRDPALAKAFREAFLAPRRRLLFDLLREGIEAGELRPDLDVELAADQLTGPFVMRKLFTGSSLGEAFVTKLTDYLFNGWGARGAQAAKPHAERRPPGQRGGPRDSSSEAAGGA
jgi:AcrR family transcriptional regulator